MTRELKGNNLLMFPKDYTLIDLETTGLSTEYDVILEVAAIRVRDGEAVESFLLL